MDESRLLGSWVADPQDFAGLDEFGCVELCFSADGSLRYTIKEKGRCMIILLRYYVVGEDTIVTEQPSAPKKEKTRFYFTDDGRLVLSFCGARSRYVRTAVR